MTLLNSAMKPLLGEDKRTVALGLNLLMMALIIAYLVNIDSNLVHDDEGAGMYEAWRSRIRTTIPAFLSRHQWCLASGLRAVLP